ncbi:hypothetical protein [Schwartzia sp. (in: firmicutes)]|nr:hypothetical protein [Schwartzia sp. (in: firmicutes)]
MQTAREKRRQKKDKLAEQSTVRRLKNFFLNFGVAIVWLFRWCVRLLRK